MESEKTLGAQHLHLSVAEVAACLGVPARTVRHWADIGYLPARRTPGGQRRFCPAEIRVFAERRSTPGLLSAPPVAVADGAALSRLTPALPVRVASAQTAAA